MVRKSVPFGRRAKLTKTGRQNDGASSTQLHRETTSGRVERQSVTQVAHDVVSVGPDTEGDTSTTEAENPDWDFGLASGDRAGVPDLVDSGVRTDGVGDVVGTVGEGGSAGGHDLHERVQELGLVVVVLDAGVHLLEITGKNALLLLHVDNVLVDTGQEDLFEHPEEHGAREQGALGTGSDDGLVDVVVVAGRGVGLSVGVVLDDLLLTVGGAGLDVVAVGVNDTTAGGIKLFLGQVAGVEVADTTGSTLGLDGRLRAAEKKGTLGNVPPAKLPVVLEDDAVQPRDKEDGDDESPSGTNTDNHARSLGIGEVNFDGTTLPDDQHGEQRGGDAEVDGGEHETLDDGVFAEHDAILGDGEDDSTKSTGETRGDDPGEEDGDYAGVDATAF